jgi:biotin carboxyl carrier protein
VIYEVEINGRMRRVEIERAGTAYAVSIDGRRRGADVTVINGVWSLILGDDGARRSYEVAIAENPPASGNLMVYVNGRLVAAAVGAARGSWAQRGNDTPSGGNGPRAVTAPMPGKIVKVLVKPGDAVTARQGLVVVEAMKMENELRAPKAGVVAQVNVAEGASVEAGAVLVVIE